MGLNLLEKTELWVNEITLANANKLIIGIQSRFCRRRNL